ADEGDDGVEDEGVFSGDDSSCISELNQSMEDEGCKVECLNEVVKVSESDEMRFDLGSSAEIVSCSGNDIDIETNSGSEQEVVGCISDESIGDEGCKVEYLNEVHELSKLNEMSNTVNESEPDVVDVYRTESKNRLSEPEEEMTITSSLLGLVQDLYHSPFTGPIHQMRDDPGEKYTNVILGYGVEDSHFVIELTYTTSSYDLLFTLYKDKLIRGGNFDPFTYK
ncbi:hypothetical protein Tco_1551522, partial [Tanacetum coccineum]